MHSREAWGKKLTSAARRIARPVHGDARRARGLGQVVALLLIDTLIAVRDVLGAVAHVVVPGDEAGGGLGRGGAEKGEGGEEGEGGWEVHFGMELGGGGLEV